MIQSMDTWTVVNVDSSEEDMEVSDAASVGDEPWNKVTGIVPHGHG